MIKTIIVNFFGGPGTGKSTTTAYVYALLKQMDINCEMAREYAKDMVWENSLDVLKDQIYLFGHQYHRLHVLNGKVRVVLCDSPLIMGLVYAKDTLPISEYNPFRQLLINSYNNMDNLNIFLHRTKRYESAGRCQTEYEAKNLDKKIKNLLNSLCLPYEEFGTNSEQNIMDLICSAIGEKRGT